MSNETQTKTCDMQAWIEQNQPNEHHEHLRKSVGEWSVAGKFWMEPGQPPSESEGSSTITAILDGRYTQHEYSSSFMGSPFSGVGIDASYIPVIRLYTAMALWTSVTARSRTR